MNMFSLMMGVLRFWSYVSDIPWSSDILLCFCKEERMSGEMKSTITCIIEKINFSSNDDSSIHASTVSAIVTINLGNVK
jgi:hypothetical protein